MIDTIIFDIGNVLMRFDWPGFMKKYFDNPEVIKRVTKAMFDTHLWEEFDRGYRENEDILAAFIHEDPGVEDAIRFSYERIEECCHAYSHAIPWIKELKEQNYQVLFLSNYSHYLMDAAPDVLNFLPYMDGGVFSCDVHLLKPEEAIYTCICEKYSLTPQNCIFLDDTAVNIDAANAFGIHGILFTNYEEAHMELENLLSSQS